MTKDQSPLPQLATISEDEFSYVVLSEKFEVSLTTIKAGARIAPHRHERDVFNRVLSGRLTLLRDQGREELRPGDWMHLPAGQEHAVEANEEVTLLELWRR